MKASWKGSISFGMVYFPVNVYTATTDANDIKYNQLHRKCNTRIRYKKYCDHCDQEVEQGDIVRGYEYEKDKYIVISDEDYEKLPVNLMEALKASVEATQKTEKPKIAKRKTS